MKIFNVALIAFLLVLSLTTVVNAAKFLLFSDLHLDPHYGTSKAGRGNCHTAPTATQMLGAYGCDSPMALIEEAAREAGSVSNLDAVLITGDLIRHDGNLLTAETRKEIVRNITGELYKTMGKGRTVVAIKPQIFGQTLGNNDAPTDYFFNVSATEHDPILTELASNLQKDYFLTPQEATNFAKCGYLKRTIAVGKKNKNVDIISFNTLLWNLRITPPLTPDQIEDPCGQLKFLEDAIASSTNPIIMMSHIPPGLDLFKSESQVSGGTPIDDATYFWNDRYTNPFYALVKKNNDRIKAIFLAHTHHAFFIADKNLGVPTLVVSSISPIYYNAPNYMTLEFDDETLDPQWGTLTQIALQGELFAESPKTYWNVTSPSFAETYQLSQAAISTSSTFAQLSSDVDAYADEICTNETAALAFYAYSAAYGKPPTTCSDKCRLITSCYIKHLTRDDTVACYKAGCGGNNSNNGSGNKKGFSDKDYEIIGGIIGGILLVAIVFVAVRHTSRSKGGPALNTESPGVNNAGGGGTFDEQQNYRSQNDV